MKYFLIIAALTCVVLASLGNAQEEAPAGAMREKRSLLGDTYKPIITSVLRKKR